jgi:hypothetical protein
MKAITQSKKKTNLLFALVFGFFIFSFHSHCLAQENELLENEAFEEDEDEIKGNTLNHTATLWYKEMKSERPNVLKAETAFNNYFVKHPLERSKEKKIFTRWLQTARLSIDEKGNYLPYVIQPLNQNSGAAKSSQLGNWRMIGPNYAAQTTCGTSSSLSGGFCDRVYINPKNTNNLFAGFSYGGLWVSLDQGATWDLKDANFSNGTNGYANRDYYYGEIEASKVDSSIIYAATEAGLLKSINSGVSWTMCPQLNRSATSTLRPYYVALSTINSSVVLSTFGKKVFQSTDDGNTWTLAFDNTAGGSNHYYTSQYNNNSNFGIYERTYNFFGLEVDHNDPSVFYLGVWNAANQACIYKSSNAGVSFNLLVNLDIALNRNMPNNLIFQTIPAQPDRFYVYEQFGSDTLYRFNDVGTLHSKTKIATTVEAGDINWLNESSMYTGFYFASSIMKSDNGAVSFTDKTSGYAGCPKYVHPDVRGIDVVGNLVLIGSDGGLAMSTDSMNSVYTIGREISAIDLWGFSSSPKSDIASAGCDHGPSKIRRFDGNNGWISRGGGDASETSVNQSNDKWIYYNTGYGIRKTELDSNNNFISTTSIVPGISLERLEFHPNLYFISYGITGNEVRISKDNLTNFSSFYNFGQTVNVFKVAQQNPLIMYVLLTNNTIKKSINGGTSWTTITPPTSVSIGQSNIVDITLGDDPMEIWAAYGNAQITAKALKSMDGGVSWTNITSSNLPTTPVSQIVYQRGTQGGVYLAFAGQSGVWYRNNNMALWAQLGAGLPMIGYLRNTYTVPAKGKFRMGSSRGAWETDLYEASLFPIANFAAETNSSKCPKTAISFTQNCSQAPGATSYSWSFPGGTPATSTLENPKVKYTNVGQYSVSLTVTDTFGNSNTKTINNFITVQASICSADTTAGLMLDLPASGTARVPLAQVDINGNDFTISTWVKLKGLQGSFSQILSTEAPNSRFGLGFAFMGYTPNTNLVFTLNNVSYSITSSINLDTVGWHHIAITYSTTSVKIYVDGKTPWVYTGTFAPVDFSQTNFWVNSDIHNQNGNFRGQLDEICFYNKVLTQQEIREKIHLVKNPFTEIGLKGYYQFNQYDASNTTVYEVITGNTSSIASNLLLPSPIPVASGSFHRIANVTNGISNFSNAGIQINFPTGTAPNGEMVATRLNTNPNGSPVGTVSTYDNYWIIRNWGTQTVSTPTLLSFANLGNIPTISLNTPSLTHKLYKRNFNDFGNTWSAAIAVPDSVRLNNNGTAYYGNSTNITSFGQYVIGSIANLAMQENLVAANKIEIYPNPTHGKFTLLLSIENADVKVINMIGQEVLSAKTTQKEMNFELNENGIYIVYVKTKLGTVTKKLVVNR